MKKYVSGIVLFLASITYAHADYSPVSYDNVLDFENAMGGACEAATDGCNQYFLSDGKVLGGTKMYCENMKIEWSCTKYRTGIANSPIGESANYSGLDEKQIAQVDRFFKNVLDRANARSEGLKNRFLRKLSSRIDGFVFKMRDSNGVDSPERIAMLELLNQRIKNEMAQSKKMHSSWDADGNGVNDCENEGICDHTIDYSKPRN